MNILVTGAAGNIAQKGIKPVFREVAKRFHPNSFAGDSLIGIDIKPDDGKISEGYALYQQFDVTSPNADWSILRGIDVVINAMMAPDALADQVHVEGTKRLCIAMVQHNVGRIVQCSTMSIYENPVWHSVPRMTEDLKKFPPTPASIYATTKWEQEKIVKNFARCYNSQRRPFQSAVAVLLGVTETASVGYKTWEQLVREPKHESEEKKQFNFVHVHDVGKLLLYLAFSPADKVFSNTQEPFERYFSGQGHPNNKWSIEKARKMLGFAPTYCAFLGQRNR